MNQIYLSCDFVNKTELLYSSRFKCMRNPEKDQDFGKIATPGSCDGSYKRRICKYSLIFEKKEKFTWLSLAFLYTNKEKVEIVWLFLKADYKQRCK